ncbi:MAG: hypothetical protein QOH08_1782 [Chloroflexota bacterium]|nr:hypothetical protein [Chloroflexota bacterium]
MGVHLAIAELSRPPRAAAGTQPTAPVFDAACEGIADTEHATAPVCRDPLSLELARMVQRAVELSSGAGLHALTAVVAHQPAVSARVAGAVRPTDLGERTGPLRAFLSRPGWLASRACMVMLVCSMAAGTTFATADALPDEPLHGMKIATEQLQVSLARSPERLVSVELAIAGSRLREAAVLEARGREASAEAAVSAYGEHIALAAATLAEIRPAPSAALLDQFRAQVVSQQESLPPAADVALGGEASTSGARTASAAVVTAAQAADAGADSIASSAANVATTAAANVAVEAAPAAAEQPSSPAPATVEPPATAQARTAAPQVPAAGPATSAPTTSAPTTSAPKTTAPTTTAPATLAAAKTVPTTTAPTTVVPTATAPKTTAPTATPPAPAQVQKDDKTKAAAKAAQESAARAQEAATRARNATEQSRDNNKNAKDQKPKR